MATSNSLTQRLSRCGLVLIVGLSTVFVSVSQATALPVPSAETGVTAYDYQTQQLIEFFAGQSCPAPNLCSFAEQSILKDGGVGFGRAQAVLEPGLVPTISAYASIEDPNTGPAKAGLILAAGGRFRDNLTILPSQCVSTLNPLPAGCTDNAFFIATFSITGSASWFSPVPNDSGLVELFTSWDEDTLGAGSRLFLQTDFPVNGAVQPINVTMLALPFQFGVPFTIQPAFAVQAKMPYNVPDGYEFLTDVKGDFSNAFTLSNIAVFDAQGNRVSVNISSDSGADYAKAASAVPEPASSELWVCGLCALTGLRLLRRPDRHPRVCAGPSFGHNERRFKNG